MVRWIDMDSEEGKEFLEALYTPIVEDFGIEAFDRFIGPIADSIEAVIDDMKSQLRSLKIAIEPVFIMESKPLMLTPPETYLERFIREAQEHDGVYYYCIYMLFSRHYCCAIIYCPVLEEIVNVDNKGIIKHL